jgi:fumarylacetoacetase
MPEPPAHHGPDPTLDPGLRSWVESANDPATDFPIQNLPLCAFITDEDERASRDRTLPVRFGVAIGDRVVDVDMLAHTGLFDDSEPAALAHRALHAPTLNALLAAPEARRYLRAAVQRWLLDTPPGGQSARRLREKALLPMDRVRFLAPCAIGDYTDFYASIHHARTVGSMFRPDNPLLPNYRHVPIGYHGRASSIVISGTGVRRPRGQTRPDDAAGPVFGPSRRLDYELELGCIIGPGNALGEPIPIDRAHEHIAGFVLVNDWSARDVQAWEYQPLGPFLAKNFATSISPFIVAPEALAPFRVPGPPRAADDPAPLDYLRPTSPEAAHWALDLTLEVLLSSERMRREGMPPVRVSRGRFREMYWTFPQMIAHHTCNGCNLQPGDLLASGTVSGPEPESRGCLLERTWDGTGPDGKPLPRRPVELPTGEKRLFLEDGDEVILRGYAERQGLRRIGLGECRGIVLPAPG